MLGQAPAGQQLGHVRQVECAAAVRAEAAAVVAAIAGAAAVRSQVVAKVLRKVGCAAIAAVASRLCARRELGAARGELGAAWGEVGAAQGAGQVHRAGAFETGAEVGAAQMRRKFDRVGALQLCGELGAAQVRRQVDSAGRERGAVRRRAMRRLRHGQRRSALQPAAAQPLQGVFVII